MSGYKRLKAQGKCLATGGTVKADDAGMAFKKGGKAMDVSGEKAKPRADKFKRGGRTKKAPATKVNVIVANGGGKEPPMARPPMPIPPPMAKPPMPQMPVPPMKRGGRCK